MYSDFEFMNQSVNEIIQVVQVCFEAYTLCSSSYGMSFINNRVVSHVMMGAHHSLIVSHETRDGGDHDASMQVTR